MERLSRWFILWVLISALVMPAVTAGFSFTASFTSRQGRSGIRLVRVALQHGEDGGCNGTGGAVRQQ